MSVDMFLFLMLAVSVLTGLFTEAIKKVLDSLGTKCNANLMSGAVATVLAVCVDAGYIINKVMQAIMQMKVNKSK